jgi:hypothetical protein
VSSFLEKNQRFKNYGGTYNEDFYTFDLWAGTKYSLFIMKCRLFNIWHLSVTLTFGVATQLFRSAHSPIMITCAKKFQQFKSYGVDTKYRLFIMKCRLLNIWPLCVTLTLGIATQWLRSAHCIIMTHYDDHLCQVICKNIQRFKSYGADTSVTDGRTDGRTDGKTDILTVGGHSYNPLFATRKVTNKLFYFLFNYLYFFQALRNHHAILQIISFQFFCC